MRRLLLPLFLVPLFLAGCGPKGPPMGIVKGTVTINGQPLKKGMIQFKPDQDSPASIEINDGVYQGKAIIAFSRVLITSPKVVGKRKRYDTADSPEDDVVEEGIPAKYNQMSGLQRDVTQGENVFDFNLDL